MKIAAFTERGRVRRKNEDALLAARIYQTSQPQFVFLDTETGNHPETAFSWLGVADGLGGHPDGAVASSLSLELLTREAQPFRSRADVHRLASFLTGGLVDSANQGIGSTGMSSTLTALHLGAELTLIHCGDCRAYEIVPEPRLLTQDHTQVFQSFLSGELSMEQLRRHPLKNRLMRCIQANETLPRFDTHTLHQREGLRLMLASDGIWESVEHEELMGLATGEIEGCCRAIHQAYLKSGANDNGTVLIVEF